MRYFAKVKRGNKVVCPYCRRTYYHLWLNGRRVNLGKVAVCPNCFREEE